MQADQRGLALDGIGRCGAAGYEFARAGSRTVLVHSTCRSPWHYVPPSYVDESGCACAWLVNPSGGLVGGDRVSVDVRLQTDAHVLVTNPSANRIYRSLSEPAVQDVRLTVGSYARLEWLPEVTIPFAGSRFHQSIQVELAPGATVVLWDAMASGRIAKHERWAFADFRNEIQVRYRSGGSVIERFQISPRTAGRLRAQWDYAASLFVLGDGLPEESRTRLESRLARLCDRYPGSLLGGVSETAAPGLAVKLLARSAPHLTAFQDAAWTAIRACLWKMPAPRLRKY